MQDFQAFRGKKILITGGLGFIGSSLARRLVALGAELTQVDSLIPSYGGNLFNLAGQTSHLDSMTSPQDDLDIDAGAQLSILEACRKYNPDVKIVFASSMASPSICRFMRRTSSRLSSAGSSVEPGMRRCR